MAEPTITLIVEVTVSGPAPKLADTDADDIAGGAEDGLGCPEGVSFVGRLISKQETNK